jgi:hypothetical protein
MTNDKPEKTAAQKKAAAIVEKLRDVEQKAAASKAFAFTRFTAIGMHLNAIIGTLTAFAEGNAGNPGYALIHEHIMPFTQEVSKGAESYTMVPQNETYAALETLRQEATPLMNELCRDVCNCADFRDVIARAGKPPKRPGRGQGE